VPGYKALILDKESMRMFSPLCGRSELADKDVVLVERLDGRDDKKREHQELKVLETHDHIR
jgi:hypothetical protein